ncbi:hypothetical protein WDU94_014005 [Cyamophila willieti]
MDCRIPDRLSDPSEWERFKQKFELFLVASDKLDKDNKTKIALLLNVGGDFLLEVYNELDIKKETYPKVIQALDGHFAPQSNKVFERFKFFQLKQEYGEELDSFVHRLRKQGEKCDFSDDSIIRDMFVIGVEDRSVKSKLLDKPDLTLVQAIEIAKKTMELSKEVQLMTEKIERRVEMDEVDEIHGICKYCGLAHKKGRCPAYNKRCNYCKKINHFENVCSKKKMDKSMSENVKEKLTSNIHEVVGNEEFVLDEVFCCTISNNEWSSMGMINNKEVKFKLDSGAQCNVIPSVTLEHIVGKSYMSSNLKPSDMQLFGYGNNQLSVLGSIILRVFLKRQIYNIKFIVVDTSIDKIILGLKTCMHLNLIKKIDVHPPKKLMMKH